MTTNLTEHQWKLIDALREGKKLLYMGKEKSMWPEAEWLGAISVDGNKVSIAPEVVVTRLYGFQNPDGTWSEFTTERYSYNTHYMEIDSNAKQVTPITKLGDV